MSSFSKLVPTALIAGELLGPAEVQLLQRLGDRGPGLGLAAEADAVLHVHADAVDPEGEGFVDFVTIVAGHVEQGAA